LSVIVLKNFKVFLIILTFLGVCSVAVNGQRKQNCIFPLLGPSSSIEICYNVPRD